MNQRGKKKNELKEMSTISETSRTIYKRYNIQIIGVPEEDKKKDHPKQQSKQDEKAEKYSASKGT